MDRRRLTVACEVRRDRARQCCASRWRPRHLAGTERTTSARSRLMGAPRGRRRQMSPTTVFAMFGSDFRELEAKAP